MKADFEHVNSNINKILNDNSSVGQQHDRLARLTENNLKKLDNHNAIENSPIQLNDISLP